MGLSFKELLERNPRLQQAEQAYEHYRRTPVPEFLEKDVHDKAVFQQIHSAIKEKKEDWEPSVVSNKRHIVTIDDISRINYEMIKNAPGHLSSSNLPIDEIDENLEQDVTVMKTRLYKDELYRMNDAFLTSVCTDMLAAQASEEPVETDTPSLEDQHKWLAQIQRNLIDDLCQLTREEKKWFVLKELLLEANAELDLASRQEFELAEIVPSPQNSLNNGCPLVFRDIQLDMA